MALSAPCRTAVHALGGLADLAGVVVTLLGKGFVELLEERGQPDRQLAAAALVGDGPDLLVPAEVVRDEKGNIIGCRSLGV